MTTLRPHQPLAPRHSLPRSGQVDRDRFLLELCRGKRVLHLACAAWPATEAWCQNGSLLHLRLGEVTQELAGFDWSLPGIEVLERFGVENLFHIDLLRPSEVERGFESLGFQPDIILAGELLEHLDRPGVLLENCRRHVTPPTRMVITVPNAFSLPSFLHLLRGYEKVAPDHVGYYSYSTIRELTARNGFQLDRLSWYRYSVTTTVIDSIVRYATAPLIWLWPQLSEGLIAECSLRE